jgi:hypothetical protein
VQRIRGGGQIHRRRNTDHGFQVFWSVCAQLTRQLQHQVAAHGVADQRKGTEAFFGGERSHDRCDIGRKAGMIQCR